MSTLIEVDISTIREVAQHFKKCKARGQQLIAKLKERKISVRTWVFFHKEISVWQSVCSFDGWHGRGYYAAAGGFVTEEEGRLIDLAGKWYDFEEYTKHGKRVFLNPGDYRSLIWISETKLC